MTTARPFLTIPLLLPYQNWLQARGLKEVNTSLYLVIRTEYRSYNRYFTIPSQAIILFYISPSRNRLNSFSIFSESLNINLPRQIISIPVTILLSFFILRKGANFGVKALYIVAGIMLLVLLLFFFGRTDFQAQDNTSIFSGELRNMKDFFVVFAIVFPAFTGMTAGVELSGDLKNPAKSIPLGTIPQLLRAWYIFW